MELRLIHEDARGRIYEFHFKDRSFKLLECVNASLRGGHFHKTDSLLLVLHGSITYKQIDPSIGDPSSVEKNLRSGDIVKIPAGIAHLIIAEEDSLLIEWLEGEYESTNYPEWRKLVEDFIYKHR